jgi:hypothetical protein
MKIIICILLAASIVIPLSGQNVVEELRNKTEAERDNVKSSQQKKNPHLAALLGIIPGVGQAYLGNPLAAVSQMSVFLALSSLEGYYLTRPDYIPVDQRDIKFSFTDMYTGRLANQNGLAYNNLPLTDSERNKTILTFQNQPIFGENQYERMERMIQEKKLVELNPWVKYGDYDALNNPVLSTMMYSSYSAFRDAGGTGKRTKDEDAFSIASAPFDPDVLKEPTVFVPIALIAVMSVASYKSPGKPILAPDSVRRDGTLPGVAFINGISPAIGEEAFFRGYLNESLIVNYGPIWGIAGSSTLFMLAHEGTSDAAQGRLARLAGGVFLGWLHIYHGFDIRPGTAVHFWYNFLLSLAEISQYHSDRNYSKSNREVFYMPISYTLPIQF